MTGIELLQQALLLVDLQETGLITKDDLSNKLDKLIEQDRTEADRLEHGQLNSFEDDE